MDDRTNLRLDYEEIGVIKESDKAKIVLASVPVIPIPVVVKQLSHAKSEIFGQLKQLPCRHLPEIYSFWEEDEGITVIEKYENGTLLSEYIDAHSVSWEMFLDFAIQMCETLECLHSCNPPIIHRDIKPNNFMLTPEGVLKLLDFDSARLYEATRKKSETVRLGTVEYAPPEQFGFSQTDIRSDVYSLGVVLRELLTHVSAGGQKGKKRVEQVIAKATSFAPENRYATVTEMRKALERAKKASWRPVLATGLGLAALLAVGLFLFREKDNYQTGTNPEAFLTGELETEGNEDSDSQPQTTGNEDSEGQPQTMENEAAENQPQTTGNEDTDIKTEESALQKYLESNGLCVLNYYKNEVYCEDIWYYNGDLSGKRPITVTLFRYQTGEKWQLTEGQYEQHGAMSLIYSEYLAGMPDGYYQLHFEEKGGADISIWLRIFGKDTEPPEYEGGLIYNDWNLYSNDQEEPEYVVLSSERQNRFSKLCQSDGNPLPEGAYSILEKGRVLEIPVQTIREYATEVEWSSEELYMLLVRFSNDGVKELYFKPQ